MQTAIPPTVMVINDDALQLRLTVAWIEKDGLRVLACKSAEKALGLLRQGVAVDVIVTDLYMPGIDGWRLCRLLRSPEYAAFNHVPILVLSATFSGADAEQMSIDLGANAFLAMPYDPAALRAHVHELLAGRTPRAHLRALIVEDSHTLATLLLRTLEAHGYTVDVALTGAAGLHRLQEDPPALAILDYHLPDMTGDRLLAECTRPERPVVAIMMTTDPTPELALHCMRLGAHGYIRKPFDPEYLLTLCARALRERALLRVEELLEERTRELRTSEAQFRLLFESIPDAICVHAVDGTILALNEVGARWIARHPAEVVGQPISTLFVPQGPLSMGAPQFPTVQGNTTTLQTICMARTGHRMAVEVTARPIEFQGQAAILSVARDITERERAMVVLQAAKDYAENIIDSSLDSIVSVDPERRIIAMNKAAQQAFGYQPVEVLGQPVPMLYADPAVGHSIYRAALADGQYTGEIMHKRQDGTLFEACLSASVLRDDQGQVIGVMGISRDITAQKRAEAALHASKDAAEAANRSKSAFLANVSHEIRTPLNGILGMTELALGTALNVEQREYLELMKMSAEALLKVTNDLLDFSKIEAGKLVLDPGEFALRVSLTKAMKTLAVPAHCKGLALVYEVHPDVPDRLIGDVGRLRQIIVNLVSNAIKFTATGQVALCLEALPSAGVTRAGGRGGVQSDALARDSANTCVLHVSVADTGIGIPAAQQQAIFQPFVQADSSMTRRYGGTGLGLSIAAQLVGLMGGRLWVESVVGAGSTFHFTVLVGVAPGQSSVVPAIPQAALWEAMHQALARAQQVTPVSPQPEVLAAPAARPLQVLLAEDNPVNQHLAVRLLEKRGHTVTVAQDGTEAVAAVRRHTFDLVLMDIQMPYMDGLEATQAIRAQEQGTATHVLIVAMTAYAMQGDRERCLAAGMDGYVSKPLRPAELFEVIDSLTAPAVSPPERPPVQAAEQEILDRKTLWERVDGDAVLLREIVELFLADCPERLLELHEALTRRDYIALAGAAHRLKGALGNISANNALAAVQCVETAAWEGDVHAATEALARLEDELTRLMPLLTVCAGYG